MASDAGNPQGSMGNADAGPSSVVIVGMRGAGKTSLGEAAATSLGWPFIDLDRAFEAHLGQTIASLVAAQGWPAFRAGELATLQRVLRESPTRTVVACGGGIVETPEAHAILKDHHPVVHIRKPLKDVERALAEATSRAKLPEYPEAIWQRREPLYQSCSDYEFCLCEGESDWKDAGIKFTSFVQRVTGSLVPNALLREDTFFLSITSPEISEVVPVLHDAERGVDALELRVDLLKSTEPGFVRDQLSLLRRASSLPVVFTVRSKDQGGAFDGPSDKAAELMEIGLLAACEFVDVEAVLMDSPVVQQLLNRKWVSLLIGSHHDMKRMPPLDECEEWLKRCILGGRAAVAKLVVGSTSAQDCVALHNAVAALKLPIPLIAINAGFKGGLSRMLNRVFSPVTHPCLAVAAPGQLTAKQIMEARIKFGISESRSFYIFGSPVKASPSPCIHNTGFKVNLSPHVYDRYDSPDPQEVLKVLRGPGCGGGSVTIPLKELMMPLVDSLSEAARAIGALNTITVGANGHLSGDNTDWLGIRRQFERKLRTRPSTEGALTALVLGAGGTARAAVYAFRAMGCSPVLVYNRTIERAEGLAKEFGDKVVVCHDPAELSSLPRLDLVMGTVPGDGQVVLPEAVLQKYKPIVFEAAYRPRETELLKVARACGCPTIEGVEMLFEQGCAQCEIWTGRKAPRAEIAAAMLQDVLTGEEPPEGLQCEVRND